MSTSEIELLASYWTIAGRAYPHTDREYSPFDFKDRVVACAQAGYTGIGLWHSDIDCILETWTVTEMKQICDDNGIRHIELEFLTDWFSAGERRRISDEVRKLLLETAEALGARHIKIGDFSGDPQPMEKLVEEFSTLCAQGAEHGTDIIYEIIPGKTPGTLKDALTMVSETNADNGGLMLDLWHIHTLQVPHSEIEAIPLKYLKGVELNDGPAVFTGDWRDQTINHRQLCGDGRFDISGFINAVQKTGYKGPYGIEVLNKAMREWSLEKLVTRSFETTIRQFET